MNASGFFSTHDSARGLSRGRRSGLLSMSHAELSAREPFPLLDASASRFVEAALFFLPPQGECCFLPPPLPLSSWTGGDITSPLGATRRWRTASHRLGGWCQPRMQGHGGMAGTTYIPWWQAGRLLPWLTHSQRAASSSFVCPPPRLHLPHKVALVYHPDIGCAIWAAAGSLQLPLHRSIPLKRRRVGCTWVAYRSRLPRAR